MHDFTYDKFKYTTNSKIRSKSDLNIIACVIKKYSKHLVDALVVIKIHLKDVKNALFRPFVFLMNIL